MTAPKARLSTLVTLNWRVKPTEAIASTAAVTRPKPTEATNRLNGWPVPGGRGYPARPGGGGSPGRAGVGGRIRSSGQCPQFRGGDVAHGVHRAVRAVGVDLEDTRRVVVAV